MKNNTKCAILDFGQHGYGVVFDSHIEEELKGVVDIVNTTISQEEKEIIENSVTTYRDIILGTIVDEIKKEEKLKIQIEELISIKANNL